MKKTKSPRIFFSVCSALLALLGLLILLGLQGFSFSAYCCFGAAGVIVCYSLLGSLQKKLPKLAKVLRMILTVFLIIGLLAALITGIFVARSAVGDTTVHCDYVIVLGAGVNGTVPSMSLRERIDAAADYLKDHPDTCLRIPMRKNIRSLNLSNTDCNAV